MKVTRLGSHGLFDDRSDPVQVGEAVAKAPDALFITFDNLLIHPAREKAGKILLPSVEIAVVYTRDDLLTHREITQPQKTIHIIHPLVWFRHELFVLDHKCIVEIFLIRLENLMTDQPVFEDTGKPPPVDLILAVPFLGSIGNCQWMPQ